MPKDIINTLENKNIKLIKKLINFKKTRDEKNLFVLESPKAILETDKNLIEFILINQDFDASKINHTNIIFCSNNIFKKITDTQNSQGIIAVVKKPKHKINFDKGVGVFLDNIQDPGNVGTIIRTAFAFDCSFVAYDRKTADPFCPKATRASAGQVLKIPLLEINDYSFFVEHKIKLIATSSKDFHNKKDDVTNRLAVVFSNEGNGISKDLKSIIDGYIKIDHNPKAESLNVSVSAGIILERFYKNI